MKVIDVYFGGSKYARTAHRYQWDKGQRLVFHGITLPPAYRVDFSNDPSSGTSISMLGNSEGVDVPNSLFEDGRNVFAWLVLSDGGDDERTVYVAETPVKKRPKPEDVEPTDEEKSIIQQAIEALNGTSRIYVDSNDYLRFDGGK